MESSVFLHSISMGTLDFLFILSTMFNQAAELNKTGQIHTNPIFEE